MDSSGSIPGLTQRETVVNSCIGRRRPLNDLSKLEIVFLAVGLLSLLACVGLTIERLDYLSPSKCPHNVTSTNSKLGTGIILQDSPLLQKGIPFISDNSTAKDKKCGAEFTFALLILINCIFCMYHVVHGVISERPYELYIFAGSILLVSTYCVIDFIVGVSDGIWEGYTFNVKLARLVILLVLGVSDVILGCWIAAKFLREGRFACNVVQCYDEDIQRDAKVHFFAQSLLTFDLEFQVTMLVLILRNGFEFNLSDEEMGILIAGLIFALIWFASAAISLRFENRPVAWFVLVTSVLEPAYIIYKIVDSSRILTSSLDETSRALQYCVFLGGGLGILLRIVLVACFWKTSRTFQNGENLSDKIYGPTPFTLFGTGEAKEEAADSKTTNIQD